ncbi:MAG: AEC family transporter [Oscillospiraceae bacterium]|nr:AEC family transporter [Oscillospiraceae bacterium]
MSFSTVLFQMFALLIMIGAGLFAARRDMWDKHSNNCISRMIVNIFNPLLVFSSAANSVGKIPLQRMGAVGLAAAAMFLIFILAGMLLAPLFDKDPAQRKIFQLMFVFSNLGFIGIPVVNSILGTDYVVYVTEFMLVYNLVFYTYGMGLMDGRFTASSLKTMINPGNLFSIAGLLLIAANIHLPDFLLTAVTYLGNAASPLALMSVGYTLMISDPRMTFGSIKIYIFSIIKLLVLPLLLLPVLKILPIDPNLLPVCMVMLGMPVGNMPLMLGTEKGIDCSVCTSAILVSTILCIITIPILLTVTPIPA